MSSVIAANCLSTVTACSAPCRTPRTRCRRRCFVPGGIATASRKARRCAHGSSAWPRTPASKVCLWCGSQHRPKHFNEGTYTVVADCDSDLRDRFALCQHLIRFHEPSRNRTIVASEAGERSPVGPQHSQVRDGPVGAIENVEVGLVISVEVSDKELVTSGHLPESGNGTV